MKTTFVLSLEEDTAAILDELRDQAGNSDPNAIINELIRREGRSKGMAAREIQQGDEEKAMETFLDQDTQPAG